MRIAIDRSVVVTFALLFMFAIPPAHALTAADGASPEVSSLLQLEQHARAAEAREQCYLFTQLVRGYSDIASREIAAGEMDKAAAHLKRIEAVAQLIHSTLAGNTKRLKDAEKVLHDAYHQLGETIRYVSAEDKAALQSTLKALDHLHDEVLAQVFAH
jgi:hypothetical protein